MLSTSASISEFFQIWLQCPSWGTIWGTATKTGKPTWVTHQGPLTLDDVLHGYKSDKFMGKGFGKTTNYLMVDIDIDSRYHPNHEGPQAILDALESIGLVRYVLICSSSSGGIHIYFPLPNGVSTWELANAARDALIFDGITLADGTCELFPNVKAYGNDYRRHRLPLQAGSYMLDDDFQPICDQQSTFLNQWHLCAAVNEFEVTVSFASANQGFAKPATLGMDIVPPFRFTGHHQTNDMLRRLVNWGDKYLGLTEVKPLGKWVDATVRKLPGFDQFASDDSKAKLEKGWAYDWAKSHCKSGRRWQLKKASENLGYHAAVANDALSRLKACLAELTDRTFASMRAVWASLVDIGKDKFSCGFGWKTFRKHEDLWAHLLTAEEKTDQEPDPTVHTLRRKLGASLQGNVLRGANNPPDISLPLPDSLQMTVEESLDCVVCDRTSETPLNTPDTQSEKQYVPAPPGWSAKLRASLGLGISPI